MTAVTGQRSWPDFDPGRFGRGCRVSKLLRKSEKLRVPGDAAASACGAPAGPSNNKGLHRIHRRRRHRQNLENRGRLCAKSLTQVKKFNPDACRLSIEW